MSSEAADDSDEEHHSSTVCFLCRQRKTKCDRKLPKCGSCIKARVDCQYVAKPKKRGLRAGYVSELESRLDILEHEMRELKRARQSSDQTPSSSGLLETPSALSQNTSSTSQTTPRKSRKENTSVSNPESAVSDLMKLPHAIFNGLVEAWFKETQTWIPILNREEIQRSLNRLPSPVDHIDDIVLRAVIALKISYSTQAISLGYKGRKRLSMHLRSQVLVEAMANPSMSSLQALLIVAILDYGSDDIPSTFSLLAICRRMCETIGTFRILLQRIEEESPTHVGPPALERYTGDEAIPLTWGILALDAASTLGASWRDASAALVDHLSSIAFISTPDFHDSFRTHTHLTAIGLQPVHEFFTGQARSAVTPENPLDRCEEMFQNLMGYVDGIPETSYSIASDGAIDFDVCQIFTRAVSHGAIIMIYQRFVFDHDENVAEISRQRCLASCVAITSTIMSMGDFDTEVNNSPVFASIVFVAARLKLVLCRALDQVREPAFDILMHGVNMCARRWPYARRQDIVLRAAIGEVDRSHSTTLPSVFWDLKQSHLDISEQLKRWVEHHRPSLYIGNLDGPYV